MSGRTYSTTSISYGSRTSPSSSGSRAAGYDSYPSYSRDAYRVPVAESQAGYGSNDRVYSVTRNGVSVINHQKRSSDAMEPRSSDATRSNYYSSSSYRR